jgi:uncharacterized protein (TIGR03118 family)
MKQASRGLAPAAVIAFAVSGATAVHAQSNNPPNAYQVNPLVSDIPGVAPNIDPVLQNAWGVAFTPAASPFWVSDNATGCSTLYQGDGTVVTTLQVKIPLPGGSIPGTACQHVNPPPASPPDPTPAAPTGMVWNPTTNPSTAFLVPGTKLPASFIWATEDGTISAWTGGFASLTPPLPANNAVLAVDNSPGAVYKGLVFGTNVNGVFLFATNFRAGTVDVFAANQDPTTHVGLQYKQVTTAGGFIDASIPPGYAPFGIENIDGNLFVTYALQNAEKHDDVAGPGNGFVDVFDTDGHLLQRFASGGTLNSPWGVSRASAAFGRFNGKILIGNFGDGRINVFDFDWFTQLGRINVFNANGNFLDQLRDANSVPIVINGLWKLVLGGGAKSNSDTLYFTAGPNDEADGLFGTITPLSQ